MTASLAVFEGKMAEEFVDWLQREIDDRKWTQADLMRHSKLARATVSNILRDNRHPSADSCVKIAKALNLPPETVLRKAGYLPEASDTFSGEIQQTVDLMRNMSPEQRKELLSYAIWRFTQKRDKPE